MTLTLSLIHPEAAIMAADSRKRVELTQVNFETLEPIGDTRVEWDETTKLCVVRGVGCVSMWGDITRAENKISNYLLSEAEKLTGPSDLADSLMHFLREEIHAEDGGDIGFHVGGYMPDGSKALYHVFSGSDIGPEVDPKNNPQKFEKYNHGALGVALFNGKHEIAYSIFQFLLALQNEVGIATWFSNHRPEIAVRFADFVIRYAARIDPTVGVSLIQ